uniref:[histone H3]-trimethyl-L-lysine(9) demethylase n=1 Tax=Scophthalmus maximus TaxID=52904 RepID=A0A8D3E3K3_SCOMX
MASDVVSQNHGSKGIMTFYPTAEQFKNFSRYIAYVESQGAHKAGLAKIVPPKEWKPRGSYDDIDELVIPAPIQQVVTGQSGLFTQYNIQKKSMTVREFRKIANSDKFCSPHYDDFEELERKYWKNVTFNPPIYGADVNGSLYDPEIKEWNISHLDTILDTVESESGITIEGVNTPYLYFGMWKTTFAWHTEDMDLYSINYLHFGEPKSWYCVPPEHGKRLERLAQGFFPGSSQNCEAFLRHKMTLISPSILKKYGIPFEKITQEAGEFMVTFPYAYHAGFNHGFNCAESTNFATERWIEYGKQAVLCSCRKDMVKISMDVFVKKFQPDRYEQWLAGRDVLPINHSRPTPEAKEFLGDSVNDIPSNSNSCSVEICGEDGERKRTLSPKDTLQVHSYTLEKQRQPHTQLQVHSYAREHQPRHLQHKTHPQPRTQVQPSSPAPSCETTELQPESKFILTKVATAESEAKSPEKRDQEEDKPQMSMSVEALPESEEPEVQPTSRSASLQVQPQPQELDNTGKETPKSNKRKVSVLSPDRDVTPCYSVHMHVLVCVLHEFSLHSNMCVNVEFEQEEKEEWAKPLSQLWQCRPYNPEAEREYNKSMGQHAPFCSICLIFHTYHQSDSSSGSSTLTLVNRPGGRQWSKPLIPEMCFNTQTSKTNESEEGQLSNPHIGEDGTSQLVSCAQCCVRVHTTARVGISKIKDIVMCFSLQDCCLCSLRGGALQRANNDKWVHVLCAITVLEACFVNVTERSPIDLSAIPLPRFRLKCVYCRKRMKREVTGCCVQCSHGRCSTAFHPTCAQAAGILMHPDDWPFVVFVTCHRHRTPILPEVTGRKQSGPILAVGQKVICKYRNTRYYHSDVVELTTATFYEVVFDDGSYSDNLLPEDIENRDCVRLGPPTGGDAVQVRWTDGLIYGAKFVASHSIPMYLVEFEDGSQITVKREDIYTLDEDLPKRVKSRMSVASDMRFELFAQKDVKQTSKRQRVINSRYREDFVEPVIYRAIME